jgi:replication factor C large subunit
MWRYASFMMINGVNRARHSRYGGYAKYSAPTYWQKLGRAKARRNTRDAVAAKIGAYCHCSKAEARSTYIPMMMAMFEDHDYAVGLSARLKLEENEIAFLLLSEKASKKVEKIYEASRDLIEKEVDEEIDAFAHFNAPERATASKDAEKETAAEKIAEAKPKRKRRKVERDGGEEPVPVIEIVPVPEAPASMPEKAPEIVREEIPASEPEEPKANKQQRTLFEF